MSLKRKSIEQIVEILLRGKCIASIKACECIASDYIKYCLGNPIYFESYYEEWLERHGYTK
ncbi:MAG: hypothetical protein WC554_12545 [Clostridia bacterium]|jgi:hypothetical protein